MARMTKKLIRQIWSWTNECYKQCLIELHPQIFTAQDYEKDEFELKSILVDKGLPYKSKEINDLYLIKLKTLTSDQINLIVEADNKKKINRSPVTIHALMDELFERSADPETRKDNE